MISSDVARPAEEELDALMSKVDLVRLCKWVGFSFRSLFIGRLFWSFVSHTPTSLAVWLHILAYILASEAFLILDQDGDGRIDLDEFSVYIFEQIGKGYKIFSENNIRRELNLQM